jgi:hypothetical protein
MSRNELPASAPPVSVPPPAGTAESTPADAGTPLASDRRRRRWVTLALVVTVLAALVAWSPWRAQADVRDGTTLVDRAGMSARHGVDINLVAVTAAGGLVELRMQITDTDKADAVLHEPQDRPILVAEETGETLQMSTPPHHKAQLRLGGSYFFLLANAHNAIHRGSQVTVVIGDSRIEHVLVAG